MAVQIRFFPRIGVAVSVLRGTLSHQDLLEHRKRVAESPQYDPSYRLLFDVRRVDTFTVTGDQIRTFADFSQPGKPRFARMALLVADDLGYGLARIFRAYTGRHDDTTLRVFHDPRQAWDWLRSEAGP